MKPKSKSRSKTKITAKKRQKLNPRIASEFAIGVIIFLAFIIGGIFWFDSIKPEEASRDLGVNLNASKSKKQTSVENANQQVVENSVSDDSCKSHYYEGEKEIKGWFVSQDENGIVVAVSKDEVSKLPVEDSQLTGEEKDFNYKLVDPTEEVSLKIKASTQENPTTFTVRGYAEICQQPPLMSLQPASVAFKKKS
ncbi:MAG: hypothetical protein HGA61_01005 [Candidatus Moranbacteria bacterium]|nr:hypothetical protein [Candidatus Moranbacteria bacterium]